MSRMLKASTKPWVAVGWAALMALAFAVGLQPFSADDASAGPSRTFADYCVFGNQSVTFHPIVKVLDGLVGSNGDVDFGGGYRVDGVESGGDFVGGTNGVADYITADGSVTLLGGTHVANDVNAGGSIKTGVNVVVGSGGAGDAVAGGDVTLIGGNKVMGDVDSGGNVALKHNTVHVYGNVTAAGTYTQTPLAKVDGTITAPGAPAAPLAYSPISLPAATVFSSGGANVTNPGPGGATLPPGSYGAFDVTGAKTSFTFTAGDYYFDSFNYQSTYPVLHFDVSGGPIRIFVTGDVIFRVSAKIDVIGGSAANVYLETHGNFRINGGSTWSGNVFAPNGEVYIGKTDKVAGTFAGQTVVTENDITITCDPFQPPPPKYPPVCVLGDQSVSLGPIVKTGGGSVASNGDINLGGSSQVGGVDGAGDLIGGTSVVADHITVNGDVSLGGSTHVLYDVNAGGLISTGSSVVIGFSGAGNAVAGGDVTLIGGNKVYGNVDSGGNVALTVSTTHVYGNVTAAGTITGPGVVDGTKTPGGVPTPPLTYTPISLPAATPFSSGGSDITTNPGPAGMTLSPGSYGDFNIVSAQTSFTFTAGDYYFDSFNYQSTYPALHFDVSGGPIRVFVTGDVTFRASATIDVIGGTAADVYLETHGNFRINGATVWNGTVFAPNGEIYIGKTDKVSGEFWGRTVTTENDITINCVAPDQESN